MNTRYPNGSIESTTEHPAATPKTADSAPVDRTGKSIRELMATWPMGRFTSIPARELLGYIAALIASTVILVVLTLVLLISARDVMFTSAPPTRVDTNQPTSGGVASQEGERPFADGASGNVMLPWADQVRVIPETDINAAHAALADLKTGEIIASRKADELIYPASMTKVMTLIVIAENLPDEDCLKDTITISQEVYDAMTAAGSSGIGMAAGEKLTVESLIYALMLRSDGIAASELARYIAGSEEDFVELMNQKAEKMGLTNTHFMNPTGLFHKDHTSTSREIASIMAYAMNMSFCRRVLMTQSYNAPFTTVDGKKVNYYLDHNLIVKQFQLVTPNQPNAVTVVAGKTGFTDESRYCLVTYAESADGHGFVCVTAKGDSYASAIGDYLTIYNTYAKP